VPATVSSSTGTIPRSQPPTLLVSEPPLPNSNPPNTAIERWSESRRGDAGDEVKPDLGKAHSRSSFVRTFVR
jgi:hypothetical protein